MWFTAMHAVHSAQIRRDRGVLVIVAVTSGRAWSRCHWKHGLSPPPMRASIEVLYHDYCGLFVPLVIYTETVERFLADTDASNTREVRFN